MCTFRWYKIRSGWRLNSLNFGAQNMMRRSEIPPPSVLEINLLSDGRVLGTGKEKYVGTKNKMRRWDMRPRLLLKKIKKKSTFWR